MIKGKKLFKIGVFLLTLLLLNSCKEAVTEPPDTETSKDFFPVSQGNFFNFETIIMDSAGVVQSGQRRTLYEGDTTISMTPYTIKSDSIILNGQLSVTRSYFRKSVSGVFGFFDTTGVTSIIPDSLRNFVSLSDEYRLLFFPLSPGQTWPVYNVSVDLGVSRVDVVDLEAAVVMKDSIQIQFRNDLRIREVYKIQYTLNVITGTDLNIQTFMAEAWVMEDVGFYKWEGDSEIINFIVGSNVYPFETIVLEELTDYSLK